MNGIRREATRNEDMSARGRLRLMQQADGDIIVAVQSEENGLIQRGDSVEFCTIGAGGGRSPRTMAALVALMDAIDADNAERSIAPEATPGGNGAAPDCRSCDGEGVTRPDEEDPASEDTCDRCAGTGKAAEQPAAEPELLPLPTLPQYLLNRIADYGLARTEGLFETDRLDLWASIIDCIKAYASDYARAHLRAAGQAQQREWLTEGDQRVLRFALQLFAASSRRGLSEAAQDERDWYKDSAVPAFQRDLDDANRLIGNLAAIAAGQGNKDAELLDRLDAWRALEAKTGARWASMHFDLTKPVRGQITAAIDKATAEIGAIEAKHDAREGAAKGAEGAAE